MLADAKSLFSNLFFDMRAEVADDAPISDLNSQRDVAVPAMPEAVALLQLLVSSCFADLDAITNVIRNDVGLTIQLLRLSALNFGRPTSGGIPYLGELVVCLGLDQLRAMAAAASLVPRQETGNADRHIINAFWTRARMTAGTAQQLALETSPDDAETAYVAGMLRHLGVLPILLGWQSFGIESADSADMGVHMAKAWGLPSLLVDVIRGDESACTSSKSRWLLRLIDSAEQKIACG